MRRSHLFLAAGVTVIAAVTVVLVAINPDRHTAGTPSGAVTSIPGAGNTQLSAHVITPTGSGRHPLLIMPASWGATADEYLIVGTRFADEGYLVISYSQRGFGKSQGEIDFAGPQTRADVSAVIDWALANTNADPTAIGLVGVSYGAGISLLAAEQEPRIKAVVAMSGWADMAASFYPNRTPSQQAVSSLFAAAATRNRLAGPVKTFATQFLVKQTLSAAESMVLLAPTRSAINGVDALNRNHPAVMLANGYEDSYFPPSQLVTFFTKLTGPKRLQLAVGDHGGPELPGLHGTAGGVWDDATAWLDHYLRGRRNGIQAQGAVHLQDAKTGRWHTYPSWASIGRPTTLYLSGPAQGGGTAGIGGLVPAPSSGWTNKITAGEDSTADAPPIQVGDKPYELIEGFRLSGVSRALAARWAGRASPQPLLVDGAPTVQVTVTPSAPNTTLVAYLYDVDGSGNASLITYKPYTLFRAVPGAARTVAFGLEPIAWTMPAGHHLDLVIDTMDPRYQSLSVRGSTVEFSSPAASPATLTVPIG